jgi:hypothetical protein
VEDLVSDVEHHMENATEITKILSSGSVTGTVNTMSLDGVVLDEEELMKELEDMLMDDEDYTAMAKKKAEVQQDPWPSVPVMVHQQQKKHLLMGSDSNDTAAMSAGNVSYRKVMHDAVQ